MVSNGIEASTRMKTEPRLKRPTAGEPHSKLDVFACNASAALKALSGSREV